MSYFDISEDDVQSLEGKVAIITGGSSGIGLATVQLFLSKGATVIGADLQPPKEDIHSLNFSFHKTDVTSWADLRDLFAEVHKAHGHIDIVYANAGVGPKEDYLKLQQDSDGNLLEPNKLVLEINLVAVANQASLAVHYMQNQQPKGGNIVLTASCTGYQRFKSGDYVVAKHGVIGLLRTMSLYLNTPELPIRINAVAPSWTRSGLVTLPDEEFDAIGVEVQPPSAVAKSVGLLISEKGRHGQCLYSYGGRYVELEKPLQAEMVKAMGKTGRAEEDQRAKVYKRYAEISKQK